MSDWFETWFDSPFYHKLYVERDYKEASEFVDNLVSFLKPKESDYILDLACGKGRHATHLNKYDLFVDGADFSHNSIRFAKQFENEKLKFYHHDMRLPLDKSYDYILNLFTSFGYFKTQHEHQQTINNIYNALNTGGKFVLDYLNVEHVARTIVKQESVKRDNLVFNISRRIEDGVITKYISFDFEGGTYKFSEEVMAFSKDDFVSMASKAGFNTCETFGDYDFNPFNHKESNRLLMFFTK